MMQLRTLIAIGLLLGLGNSQALAQGCGGQFAANQFCGAGSSAGLPGPRLIPAGGTTQIGGGTVLGNPTTVLALPSATTAPVLGIPGTSVGSVSFGNLTSGTIKIQPVTGALGSSILSLPAVTDTLAGLALANGGTNASLTASNGGVFWSNTTQAQILAGTATARQMLQSGASATPAWSTATWPATTAAGTVMASGSANTVTASATPVLGIPGSVAGSLGLAGSTSGTVSIIPQFAAGSPSLLLPNTSGTFAVNASAPLALSPTTGNLTVTGAAGAVLAGSTPAFTATPTLGVAGSSTGSLSFANTTSGTVSLTVPSSGALGSAVITLQAVTDTAVSRTTTDTLTNKTLTSTTNTLGGVTMGLGSDATGDIYYRDSGGHLARLAIGSTGNVLNVTAGLPAWTALATSAIVFPQGRLTLTSGTPVMATSVSGATTVYYTGYAGKSVPIYNGTSVALYQICAANTAGACELSVALGSNWVTNINYDFFLGLNSGTPTLCTGPAWTAGAVGGSDTARGTGAGSTELQQLDGLNTNKNSMTCRFNNTSGSFTCAVNQCTYLGSMRIGSTGQTNFIFGASAAGGTAGVFGIWNAYNRVSIRTTVNDSNTNWNYVTGTVRSADNSTANRVSFLSGLTEDGFSCQYTNRIQIAASGFFTIGCALDSTSAFDRKNLALNGAGATSHFPIAVKNDYNPTLGWHFVQALEAGDATNNNPSAGGPDESFIFEFQM